jgi:hypothetical protein
VTNWITIVGRDKRSCIYCGINDLTVTVSIVNNDKEALAGNSAVVCKECRKCKAKKVLGMPGARVFEAEISRRNLLSQISNTEPIKPPTDDEQVHVGNFKRRLPPRGSYPYTVQSMTEPAY